MRSFKDQLEIDKKAVFLNALEFAESHKIGEKIMDCVIDAENFKINQMYGETYEIDGTFTDGFTIFANASDFEAGLPGVNNVLNVDGKDYQVLSARRDGGIFEINVYRRTERGYR